MLRLFDGHGGTVLLTSAVLCTVVLTADHKATSPHGNGRSIDSSPRSAEFVLDCREQAGMASCRGRLADWKEEK